MTKIQKKSKMHHNISTIIILNVKIPYLPRKIKKTSTFMMLSIFKHGSTRIRSCT